MLPCDVDVRTVIAYTNADNDSDTAYLFEEIILPAARTHLSAYTGMKEDELSQKEDVTIPLLALCSYLYDNRSMVTGSTAETDKVISAFLDGYRVNLVG